MDPESASAGPRSRARPGTSSTARASSGARKAAGNELPPVQERATFLVGRLNALLAQLCNPVFAEYEVDLYSSRILAAVAERKELRIGELVELMVLPQSTISHQVQRLEKRGLVRRTRTVEDNRSVAVTLTPKGRHTARICSRLSREIYENLASRLEADELEMLRALLHRMFDSLGELSGEALRDAVKARSRA